MIKVKLDILAKNLGKSVTDIADETGLNRNTVTALFHNKVDGIKFDTLEKICSVYGVALEDLLEVERESSKQKSVEPEKLYKQEGSLVPFTCFPWMIAVNHPAPEFFKFGFGYLKLYSKDNYGWGYWSHDSLCRLARYVYDSYGKTGRIDEIYKKYNHSTPAIKHIYEEVEFANLVKLSDDELINYFNDLWAAGQKFWQYSVFIDSFDPGLDQDEINNVAKKYNLNKEEIGILTTPIKPTFNNERLLSLLKIIEPIIKKKLSTEEIDKFVTESKAIRKYMREFDYYKSNYAFVKPITQEEVSEEILKYMGDGVLFKEELGRLEGYEENQKKAVKKVLSRHKLKKNPLEFFSLLTYWREDRKKINLMSIYVYDLILRTIEERTGIPKKYLQFLTHDEIAPATKKLIDKDVLVNRRESGMLVEFDGDKYNVLTGKEAQSVRDELELKLKGEVDQTTLTGQTASQGYAKGIARVILDESQFHKLKEGEILVTGMTRPEFVPVMKIAGGIVTNEGGITCHAAIVSRELGKPCIIGTRIATEIIKDGDLVEVRANHGTVRILK